MSRYFYYRLIVAFSSVLSLIVLGIGVRGVLGYHLDYAKVLDCKDKDTITLEYQTENITSQKIFPISRECPEDEIQRVWVSPEKYHQGNKNWWCWAMSKSCSPERYITMIIWGMVMTLVNLIILITISSFRKIVPSLLENAETLNRSRAKVELQ